MRKRMLELFSGTGSLGEDFAASGWDVFRVELDERFEAEWHTDILSITPDDIRMRFGEGFDFVWASPPCTSFSMGAVRHHWDAITTCVNCGAEMYRTSGEQWSPSTCKPGKVTYEPKSDTGRLGYALLYHTLDIIRDLNPKWWAIENPRALMRKMDILQGVPRHTITYCQYGDPRRMKPTDLFGVLPDAFEVRACKNGAPCHEAAPRGARTGTQGLSRTEAGMLPPNLGRELRLAIEG